MHECLISGKQYLPGDLHRKKYICSRESRFDIAFCGSSYVTAAVCSRIVFIFSFVAGHAAENADTFQTTVIFMALNFSAPATSQGQGELLQVFFL